MAVVAVSVSVATGSGPTPEWVNVADGAYQAASVCNDGAVVYVPASTRLRPPALVDESPAPEVIEEEWGTMIGVEAVSPETTEPTQEESQAFVFYRDPPPQVTTAALTVVPGGWSAGPAG